MSLSRSVFKQRILCDIYVTKFDHEHKKSRADNHGQAMLVA